MKTTEEFERDEVIADSYTNLAIKEYNKADRIDKKSFDWSLCQIIAGQYCAMAATFRTGYTVQQLNMIQERESKNNSTKQ